MDYDTEAKFICLRSPFMCLVFCLPGIFALLWLFCPLCACPTPFSLWTNLLSFLRNTLIYHYGKKARSFGWLKLVSCWLLNIGQR